MRVKHDKMGNNKDWFQEGVLPTLHLAISVMARFFYKCYGLVAYI
jgi:hypothetical protein